MKDNEYIEYALIGAMGGDVNAGLEAGVLGLAFFGIGLYIWQMILFIVKILTIVGFYAWHFYKPVAKNTVERIHRLPSWIKL